MKISNLIFTSTFYYISIFVLVSLSHFYELKGFIALWFFIPLVILLFTTAVVEMSNSKKKKSIKIIAIVDFLIRCLLLIITYLAISNIINLSFTIQLGLAFFFLLLNLLLGWRIYGSLRFYVDKDALTKEEIKYAVKDYANEQKILINKSSKEQEEIKRVHQMHVYLGYSKLLTLIIILGGIIGFNIGGIEFRIIIIISASLLLMIYFYLTEQKISLLCADKKKQRKVSFKDNFTYLIGILIIYILQGIIHIETGDLNIVGIFIACLFLLPTLNTNKKVNEKFHKVNKEYVGKYINK